MRVIKLIILDGSPHGRPENVVALNIESFHATGDGELSVRMVSGAEYRVAATEENLTTAINRAS